MVAKIRLALATYCRSRHRCRRQLRDSGQPALNHQQQHGDL